MNKIDNEDSASKTWGQRKLELVLETLKPELQVAFDQILNKTRTNIEELINSEVPTITENIREEIEKLIDHKIGYLQAGLKRIALIIIACTLPLTLGIWFLAFVLLTK